MEYLYMIRCNQYTKIGISNDVDYRLKDLQTGNPYPLALLNKFEFDNALVVERLLHSRLSKYHVRGEWFSLTDEQIEDAVKVCLEFQSGNGVFGSTFAGEALRSAVAYCIEAGIDVRWHRDGDTLFLSVEGVNYDPEAQSLVLVEK